MSNLRSEDRHNSGDMHSAGLNVGPNEMALFEQFLHSQDFSQNSQKAMSQDIKKFARWFSAANLEPFVVDRVTTGDVIDFKEHLRRNQGQAVNTVNRCLATLRRFFGWLVEQGCLHTNPAQPVKELNRQQLAPKGIERTEVRRLFRELELRQDHRACDRQDFDRGNPRAPQTSLTSEVF